MSGTAGEALEGMAVVESDASGPQQARAKTTTPRGRKPKAEVDSDESLVRLNINLTQESAAILRAAAAAKGISYTDAVRRALAITSFLDEQISQGRSIQAIGKDGTVRELVFL